MKRQTILLGLILCLTLLQSCFYVQKGGNASNEQNASSDSLNLFNSLHYSAGYNFVVNSDSLCLCAEIPYRAQQLSVMPDSVVVYCGDELIVAQFEFVPEDSVESVWVKVARDQNTQGWVRESMLVSSVVPDDPISLAISFFSVNHLKWTFVLLGLLLCIMLVRFFFQRKCQPLSLLFAVHSPYPLLLCLCIGGAAVFYASIQMFARDVWSQFYFHPTLNPFAVSPLLGAFLFSFWLIVLFTITTIDEAFRQLKIFQAIYYLYALLACSSFLYLFFSTTTLHYLGFLFFLLFLVASLWGYRKLAHPKYRCGNCGRPLHDKGECPYCGAHNL